MPLVPWVLDKLGARLKLFTRVVAAARDSSDVPFGDT
jgi:hypothetical protein